MTVHSSARLVAIVLAGFVSVHVAVWGMAAMLTDLGEGPVLNWSAWWTAEGWRTSVIVQARVALVVGLFGVVVRTFMFGASKQALSWLAIASMFCAVVLEAVVLSAGGLGPGRAEVNTLLGSFAHNGLTMGAGIAASHAIEYWLGRQFMVGHATPRTR